MFHIQCNCHCNQLYDGKASWWLQGYIFCIFCLKCELLFDFRGIVVVKGGGHCRLLNWCMKCLCRVEFIICSDVIASTVEKDPENKMLLYFVICIVIEPIRVGHCGKACFAGRKLQWLTIFVVSEYYTDVVNVCWPKNVSGHFISVSFLFSFLGWGGMTQKCKADIAFLLCNAWLLIM